MRIAVLGSCRSYKDLEWRGTENEFVSACEEIGRELARHGQTVLLVSHRPVTADAHVMKGMLRVIEATPDSRARIEVIADDRAPFDAVARKHPGHFSFPPVAHAWRAEQNLLQIHEADAVITLGGAAGTHQAGLAAIVARKTLVPIGSFGGASGHLLTLMQSSESQIRPQLSALNGPWTSHVLDTTMMLLGVSRRPRLLIIHGHSDDRYKLTEWLRTQLGLTDLLIMQQEFGGGLSLPEKFEKLAERSDGAIALATPDDIFTQGTTQLSRARQNVWLEVGWIWGRLGRRKVMLITKGQLENPSDIQGIECYSYSSNPSEAGDSIRAFVAQLSAG